MPKALVTGGHGFIGSHLVEKLQQEKWDVSIMYFPFDVTRKEHWDLKLKNIEYIFHLAGHLDNYYHTGAEADFSQYVDININI